MALKPFLLFLAAASLLTACSGSTPSAEVMKLPRGVAVTLPELPSDLRGCALPAEIDFNKVEDGLLPIGEGVKLWAQDRAALVRCRSRNRIIIETYDRMRSDLELPGPSHVIY